MTPLAALIVELFGELPAGIGAPADGLRVVATDLVVDLPIEMLFGEGEVRACFAQHRFASGFDRPLGRLRARAVAVSS